MRRKFVRPRRAAARDARSALPTFLNVVVAMLPWDSTDLTFDAERFTGVARLFPLPDLVMFPHVMQPLHIFEQRYREMLNDALDGDGLIAMSLLAPGWQRDYDGGPPLWPEVCLGKVVTHQRLDDGRYNIMLLGLRRARIVREEPQVRSFRQAELDVLEDVYDPAGQSRRDAVQCALAEAFRSALSLGGDEAARAALGELLSGELPLGVLTDLAAFALPLPGKQKRRLLAECDVDRRAAVLLDALGASVAEPDLHGPPAAAPVRRPYPLRFSDN